MTPDKTLLILHKLGWDDESNSKPKREYKKAIHQKAYDYGRIDYEPEDILPSIDNQTDKQILKSIKG